MNILLIAENLNLKIKPVFCIKNEVSIKIYSVNVTKSAGKYGLVIFRPQLVKSLVMVIYFFETKKRDAIIINY